MICPKIMKRRRVGIVLESAHFGSKQTRSEIRRYVSNIN